MQRFLLFTLALFAATGLFAQGEPIYVDQFDDGVVSLQDSDDFTFSEENGELTISGLGTNDPFEGLFFGFNQSFDLTENATVYVRAFSSGFFSRMRVDLVDGSGFSYSSALVIDRNLSTEYDIYEYDFTGADLGPDFDITDVIAIAITFNQGDGNVEDDFVLDYISVGAPIEVIESDIYQDLMNSDSSVASFVFMADGLTVQPGFNADGEQDYVTLVGDGTSGAFSLWAYQLRPEPDYVPTIIDITEDPILYVKARASVEGTILRIDVQDTDNFSGNATPVQAELADTFQVFALDMTGSAQAFAREGCSPAEPCPVSLDMVNVLLMYPDPNPTGLFLGEIDIDWISFGVNLDGEAPPAPLVYSDDFNASEVNFVGPTSGLTVEESEGSLKINGDGTSGAFGTVSYKFNNPTDDLDTAAVPTIVNFVEAQSKLYVRGRTAGGTHAVRIDVVDTTGRLTDFAGVRRAFGPEWSVQVYDYNGKYDFADYGDGDPDCSPQSLCDVDGTLIGDLLMFIRPGEGMFDGQIEIDWISVGQPLSEEPPAPTGVVNYADDLNNIADGVLFNIPDAFTVEEGGEGILVTGDGTAPGFPSFRYNLNQDGDFVLGDLVSSENNLYMRARLRDSDQDSVVVRVDLIDNLGFETGNVGLQNTITNGSFETYTYNFAGRYSGADGGFGNNDCVQGQNAPCDVDGQRVAQLAIFPNPRDGGFDGTLEINWISFGNEMFDNGGVATRDFAELDQLKLYPNPTSDQLGVEFDLAGASDVTISLFDGLGRRQVVRNLGKLAAGNNFQAIDVADLPVGTYHLQMVINGKPARAVTVLKR